MSLLSNTFWVRLIMNRPTRRSPNKKNVCPDSCNRHRDGSQDISDHLHNHLHLTNCIHLRNHMHRRSPVLADKALMRDLVVLQRSTSLRDPSTSPSSWMSPSVLGTGKRKPRRDDSVHSARRSLGARDRDLQLDTMSSPLADGILASKVGSGLQDAHQLSKGKERSRKIQPSNPLGGCENLSANSASQNSEAIGSKFKSKSKSARSVHVKILGEDSDDEGGEGVNPSDAGQKKRNSIGKKLSAETLEKLNYGHPYRSNRAKMERYGRRSRGSSLKRTNGSNRDQHIVINAIQDSINHHKQFVDEEERAHDVEVDPRNGCGIPWNWSRIQHKGRTFLDIAGRSLSRGLSDSKTRKSDGPVPQSMEDPANLHISYDNIISSTNSDSESLPLLTEPRECYPGNGSSFKEYSGELGIYDAHGLRHELDSELNSEQGSDYPYKSNGRHRCLTQKYMPKTFRDLVGQNLVAQALSNAASRRKIGLVYVFYGPHGTGKTSCARIFAKAVNCHSSELPKPCDACSSCISHNMETNKDVFEVRPTGNSALDDILNSLDGSSLWPWSSQYRVFIVDDCDALLPKSWTAIIKVIEQVPRDVVFIFISTHLDLPHMIISRCQKFFFPKLKESDIINTLQWIANSEGLQIEKEALRLIASRSDGSLRDAEMTLDQLCLIGQNISVNLVQELVGLVSDEKLVDLLDLALSADTVNTVKRLRNIMESGVEPLALMSQLATVITDILAGSYLFTKESPRRKFFHQHTLSKDTTERLRQALKILSEAERQLQTSSDKVTWLTAALLQLAPDRQYIVSSSSPDTNLNPTHVLQNINAKNSRKSASNNSQGLVSGGVVREACGDGVLGNNNVGNRLVSSEGRASVTNLKESEKIWEAVLSKLQPDSLKQFLSKEGKLVSISSGSAATVRLLFESHLNKSKAETIRILVSQAFETVLSCRVILELSCNCHKDIVLLGHNNGSSSRVVKRGDSISNSRTERPENDDDYMRRLSKGKFVQEHSPAQDRWPQVDKFGEISLISQYRILGDRTNVEIPQDEIRSGSLWLDEGSPLRHRNGYNFPPNIQEDGGQNRQQSLVKGRVSLAHVIHKAEGQHGGRWSRRKAVSIAEKLEQENLRLEPRSKSLLCWKSSRNHHGKIRRRIIKKGRTHSMLKLVGCGRCLSAKSPR